MAEHEYYAQPTVFDCWQHRFRSWCCEYLGRYCPFFWSAGFATFSLASFLVAFSLLLSMLLDRGTPWDEWFARSLMLCMALAGSGWLLQQTLLAWPAGLSLPPSLRLVARVTRWRRPAVPAGRRTHPERPRVERRARKRESTPEARRIQAFYTGVREAGVNVTIARSLFTAGLRSPGQVRRASDEDLLAIRGVGPATVRKLRTRFGRA